MRPGLSALAQSRRLRCRAWLLHHGRKLQATTNQDFDAIAFAGKTGTSSDHKDSWFTGFEHESSVTIWLGRDDNKSIGLTGGSGALTLFSQYFRMVPPNSLFRAIPPDVTLGRFSAATGRAVADDCEGTLLLPKVVSATLLTDCE